jgi:hypothetical protein
MESTVAQAAPNPEAKPVPAAGGTTVKITPDPRFVMRRAAPRLVKNTVRDQLAMGDAKVVQGELDERHALDLIEAHRVEGDIDAAGFLHHLVEMLFDGRFIQRVHLS